MQTKGPFKQPLHVQGGPAQGESQPCQTRNKNCLLRTKPAVSGSALEEKQQQIDPCPWGGFSCTNVLQEHKEEIPGMSQGSWGPICQGFAQIPQENRAELQGKGLQGSGTGTETTPKPATTLWERWGWFWAGCGGGRGRGERGAPAGAGSGVNPILSRSPASTICSTEASQDLQLSPHQGKTNCQSQASAQPSLKVLAQNSNF